MGRISLKKESYYGDLRVVYDDTIAETRCFAYYKGIPIYAVDGCFVDSINYSQLYFSARLVHVILRSEVIYEMIFRNSLRSPDLNSLMFFVHEDDAILVETDR